MSSNAKQNPPLARKRLDRTKRLELVWRHLVSWAFGLLFWRPGRRARLVPTLASARRVLLVRIDNRVGEALLTTPLVQALAERFEVELLVHPRCARVLEGLPGIKVLRTFERRWLWAGPFSRAIRELRRSTDGSVVVNCANWAGYSGTAALVSRLLAPNACVIGPAVGPGRLLADLPVAPRTDTESETSQRLHLLSPLVDRVPELSLSFRAPRPTDAVAAFRRELGQNFVLVNPGGRLHERRVPTSVFAEACRVALSLGRRTVVTWGPGEEALAREVVAAAPGTTLAPATNLDDLAFLMKEAQGVVCNNTGPMHLSVAVGTPTLALFYRMSPERWGHFHAPHHMLDVTGLTEAAMGAAVDEALRGLLETAHRASASGHAQSKC